MEKIKAKKALGQNFLIDEEALSDIASAISIQDKNIIEVGPGYGALTDYIIDQSPLSLDLVELDTDVQRGLATHAQNHRVGLFTLDHLLDDFSGHGGKVHLIGLVLGLVQVGLHGRNVGVHQDDVLPLLLQ